MGDRFAQQLKKGVLEMLVLKLICEKPALRLRAAVRAEKILSGAVLPEGRDAVSDPVPP